VYELFQRRKIACILIAWISVCASGCIAQRADYDQPYRPQVHFSPEKYWTNDPNGLVFFKGEYHLFFQFNPFGDEWGHMSWGHAVSKDLLHWKELPVAIPEQNGMMIFTGSVVVDEKNTSELCLPNTSCLVAIFTGASNTPSGRRQTQNIASSQDQGRTWKLYVQNPVLDLHKADFRDPSVSLDKNHQQWVMAVSLPKEHVIEFYSSPNLKEWTKVSDFGPTGNVSGDWECPDLLQVPAANDSQHEIWALKVGLNRGTPQGGSGEQYFLGNFDGKSFVQSNEPGSSGWTNYGKDDYCAISFNNLPEGAPPVLVGWMNNWQYASKVPTSPWRGQMSIPRQLFVLHDHQKLSLQQKPLVQPLRTHDGAIPVHLNTSQSGQLESIRANAPYELDLTFFQGDGKKTAIRIYSDTVHWVEIGFDAQEANFYMDRSHSSLTVAPTFPTKTAAPLVTGRPYNLTLIVDRSSIEAFAQDGTIAMTDLIFPLSKGSHIEFFSDATHSAHASGQLWKLESIWK
jgi:fructan beta-fructosidase